MDLPVQKTVKKQARSSTRYPILDAVRGFALWNMIAYHTLWDLVHLFGMDWGWYRSPGVYAWQQGICWTFIFISGFCMPLGSKPMKRGLIVLLAGCLISVVTAIAVPQSKILFGVLTLIGSATLILAPLRRFRNRFPPWIGLICSAGLFVLTRNIPRGSLGFESWNLCELPKTWYQNLLTAYWGFRPEWVHTTDYFPIIPWMFLFLVGYFLSGMFDRYQWWGRLACWNIRLRPLEWCGRHSLWIYLAHQPILFCTLWVVFACFPK